jgi:para-aminobenzoate synthetase component I
MRHSVVRHSLGHWVHPADAFVAIFGDDTDVFWLDSSSHADGGMSYMGRAESKVSSANGDVLAVLRAGIPAPDSSNDSRGFQLGWVGWLGYELRAQTMDAQHARESRYPDAALLFASRAIEFDHARGEVTLIAIGDDWSSELDGWRSTTIAQLTGALTAPPTAQPSATTALWRYSDDEYLDMIRECQAAIARGDAYQLCLTTEAAIEPRVGEHFDPVAIYLALREASPTHHGALIRIGEVSLLSSSPEQFLSVSPAGVVESSPIKGTRARSAIESIDVALREELSASDKERAENLMIVDLMRNDLTRVSELGSVEVTALLEVESYAHVHQLVSTVRGRLASGNTGVDAVEACFPAGSMTGAPKLAATRILDRLENRPRGIYAGAFGYFGLDGRIDLAMVIRSIIIDADGATVGSGGGITALSDPHAELDEVRLKAAALLAVLGAGATRQQTV